MSATKRGEQVDPNAGDAKQTKLRSVGRLTEQVRMSMLLFKKGMTIRLNFR